MVCKKSGNMQHWSSRKCFVAIARPSRHANIFTPLRSAQMRKQSSTTSSFPPSSFHHLDKGVAKLCSSSVYGDPAHLTHAVPQEATILAANEPFVTAAGHVVWACGLRILPNNGGYSEGEKG